MRLRSLPPSHPADERGAFLVAVLLLLVVMAMLGVWGLAGSRSGLLKAGHYRGGIAVLYEAEEGLQRAARRVQEIADPNLADSLASRYGGPELDINYLVGTICEPGSAGCVADSACPEAFDADTGLNDVTGNVVCNFMGDTLERTQVVLVRKNDHWEGGFKTAVYLVNTIARDKANRKKIVQGVIVLPYQGSSGAYAPVPGASAYLATVVRSPTL